jgi:hypothetical protein
VVDSGLETCPETFIVGKNTNRHAVKKIKYARGSTGKLIVLGAVSRKGNVVT